MPTMLCALDEERGGRFRSTFTRHDGAMPVPLPLLDHLIVAGPDLDQLVREVADSTGLRPAPGGRHDGQGTRNALLGLGVGRYLELLAPDPEQSGGAFRASIAYLDAPALHTWCVRGGDADAVARRVEAAGARPRRLAMSRQRPDGVTLEWELVFVDGHPYGGLVPFFIDWRGSPHPSTTLPLGLACDGLRLSHPDAGGLRTLLADLGALAGEVDVATGDAPGLAAGWRGPRGTGVWRGRGEG
jgi:hypothetical protein